MLIRQRKPLKIRKIEFVEIYEPFSENPGQGPGGPLSVPAATRIASGVPGHNYIPNWLNWLNEGRIMEAADLAHQDQQPAGSVRPRMPAGSPVRRLLHP